MERIGNGGKPCFDLMCKEKLSHTVRNIVYIGKDNQRVVNRFLYSHPKDSQQGTHSTAQ